MEEVINCYCGSFRTYIVSNDSKIRPGKGKVVCRGWSSRVTSCLSSPIVHQTLSILLGSLPWIDGRNCFERNDQNVISWKGGLSRRKIRHWILDVYFCREWELTIRLFLALGSSAILLWHVNKKWTKGWDFTAREFLRANGAACHRFGILINKCKRLIKLSFIVRCVWLRRILSRFYQFATKEERTFRVSIKLELSGDFQDNVRSLSGNLCKDSVGDLRL